MAKTLVFVLPVSARSLLSFLLQMAAGGGGVEGLGIGV